MLLTNVILYRKLVEFTCKAGIAVQIKGWMLGYLFLRNIFVVNNSCKVEKIKLPSF